MKIRVFLILCLLLSPSLFAKERMTHTFKSHNFRIELPLHWELQKAFGDHKHKPLLYAFSSEDRIHLEIFVYPEENKNPKQEFVHTLKHLQLWAENYTSLDQETEFSLYNLEGYWAKTMGFRQKKKINGYIIYASDGLNIFVIHTFTQTSLFPKNFLTLKEVIKGFSLNRNFKSECCVECLNLAKDRTNLNLACVDFTETEECFFYFQNRPQTISTCK